MSSKGHGGEILGHDIRDIGLCRTVLNGDAFGLVVFANEVIGGVEVFRSIRELPILHVGDCSLVVFINENGVV